MAGPITWRTVTGPALTGSTAALESAARMFDSAFSKANGLIDTQIAADKQAADNAEAERLLAYKELLGSYGSQEELEANRDRIDAARGGLGLSNRTATLDAFKNQIKSVQTDLTDRRNYTDVENAYNNRNAFNTIQAKAEAGDIDGALLELNALKESNPHHGKMVADLERLRRQQTKESQDNLRYGYDIAALAHKADMAPLEKRSKEVSIRAAEAGATNSEAQTNLLRLQMDQARDQARQLEAERQRELTRTGLVKDSSFYKDYLTPEKNVEAVAKIIESRKDLNDDQKDNLRKALGDSLYHSYKDGKGNTVRIPVPLPILETAAQTSSTSGNWLQWDQSVADNFTNQISKRMLESGPQILEDHNALQELMRYNIKNPPIAQQGKK